jgi:hypothetical protein
VFRAIVCEFVLGDQVVTNAIAVFCICVKSKGYLILGSYIVLLPGMLNTSSLVEVYW